MMNNLAETFLAVAGAYNVQMIVASVAVMLFLGLIFENET